MRKASLSATVASDSGKRSAGKAGDIKATVLQPGVYIAQLAVEQAHSFITTGSTGQPEKQSIDCQLINTENAEQFGVFGPKE